MKDTNDVTTTKPNTPIESGNLKAPFPISRKIGLGFGLLLLIFTVLQLWVISNVSKINDRFSYVVKYEAPIIDTAEKLFKTLVDMETGQRGFIITGDEDFLQPYNEAVETFDKLIVKEIILVSDKPNQVIALNNIKNLVEQWKEQAAVPEIALGRKIAMAQVNAQVIQKMLSQGLGKSILDQLRARFIITKRRFEVKRNYRGMYLVSSIEKSIVDQETGQRGFLITGKEEFLEPYYSGHKDADKFIDLLRKLVATTSEAQLLNTDIDQIEMLIKKWDREAGKVEILARREMNKHPETPKDVADVLRQKTGKNILDTLRYEFQKFIAIEQDSLEQSYQQANDQANNTILLSYSFIFISIVIGLFVAYYITRGSIRPRNSIISGSDEIKKVTEIQN